MRERRMGISWTPLKDLGLFAALNCRVCHWGQPPAIGTIYNGMQETQ